MVKKLKARCFWRYTIIGRFACYIYEAAKASENVFWKLLLLMLAVSLLSATWILLIPVLVLIFIFVPKYARKYAEIKDCLLYTSAGSLIIWQMDEYLLSIHCALDKEETIKMAEFVRKK